MKPRREPATAARILEVLRDDLYAPPSWALFSEVRSAVGTDIIPGLRVTDAIAVDTSAGPDVSFHAIEIKRSKVDLARELDDPEKARESALYCESYTLVLPSPITTFVSKLSHLPHEWGVIEIDGCRATRLQHPTPKRAEPAPPGFLKALLRRAAAHVEREASGEGDVPLRGIARHLGRDHVGLDCAHRALRPLTKPTPTRIPCYACAAGLPADPGVVTAAIEEATPEQLDVYQAQIASRLRHLRPSGPGLADCSGGPTERGDLVPLRAVGGAG